MLTGIVFAVLMMVTLSAPVLAADGDHVPARADFLVPRDFSWNSLREPESLFWPGYFWSWNGPLEPDVLRRQLADMVAHDARSVCVLPIPREFKTAVFNSQVDVDYLSPQFFERVKVAVDEAARLKMNYWFYDEGGWPSGQAAGYVLKARPETAVRVLTCNAKGEWTPRTEGMADVLDPRTTETFLKLTHERYAEAVGSHFGKTIKLVFSDESAYRYPVPGRVIPWPEDTGDAFRRWFGYDPAGRLDTFRVTKPSQLSPSQREFRVDMFDFWSRRFRDVFFAPQHKWSREHGLAFGGHLGGEDETYGAVCYGYGHVMRQLRTMDVPGVDAIWRQLFPGKVANLFSRPASSATHHFPKFASSIIHQNGTVLAFTESFAVYGHGLTPAQMKWVIDTQYVKGLTLAIFSNYSLSTRDHLMACCRPEFGPSDPLWDFMPDLHRYVARLGYVLSCGQPEIEVGLHYPVRDLWASGDAADPALCGHDRLAQELLQRQCDFDVIDDDVLGDPSTVVKRGRLAIGRMRYRTIVVGPAERMTPAAKRCLEAFQAAGGQVVRVENFDRVDAALASVKPTVGLEPRATGLRALVRRWPGGGAVFVFNEGSTSYCGTLSVPLEGTLREIEPATGLVRAVGASVSGRHQTVPVTLEPWQSLLLVSGPADAPVASAGVRKVLRSVDLADGWTARVDRQYVAGEHDFENHATPQAAFKPVALGPWAEKLSLGRDFSGHVTYRRTVSVPESMRNARLLLDLGTVEHAARVSIDGRRIGCVLWSPWQIELPPLGTRSEFVLEIEVSNTLANELTSERVREAWAKRSGPGWPSPYHEMCLGFEKDFRGGGLLGPVRLQVATP